MAYKDREKQRAYQREWVREYRRGVRRGGGIPAQGSACVRVAPGRMAVECSGEGTVYVIRCEGTDCYKVGITRGEVGERLRELQTGCPYRLVVVSSVIVDNALRVEGLLHEALAGSHVRGEWFTLDEGALGRVEGILGLEAAHRAERERMLDELGGGCAEDCRVQG